MVPVTEIPEIQRKLNHSILQSNEILNTNKERMLSCNNHCFYNTVTAPKIPGIIFKPSYHITVTEEVNSEFVLPEYSPTLKKQLVLVGLSNKMFKNALPLDDAFTDVLNKTHKRLFSKTPTRL